MPKFFKQNILAGQTSESTPPTPTELITDHTVEITPSDSPPVEPELIAPEFHPATAHHIRESHHLNVDAPTEMIFPMPKEDEPLLPSPLDTPELPEHTATHEKVDDRPVFKPQPMATTVTFNPTPFSVNPNAGFAGFPVPETKKVETLMIWRAPSRPHRKKNRSFYTTVAILVILIAMIALLAGERMLVAVLFALMFLVYVLNFIEPGEIEYKISTQGVTIDEHFYHWQELDSFWFEKKDDYSILHILTQLRFPAMLMMVLSPTTHEEEVKKTAARFLPFHEIPPKSIVEKWAEGLQKYFPLENPHK